MIPSDGLHGSFPHFEPPPVWFITFFPHRGGPSCLSLSFLTPPFYPGTRLRAFPPSILPLLSVFGVRQISLFKIWFSKLILPAEAEFCNQFTGFICGVFFFFLLSFINTHTSQLLCTQQKKKKFLFTQAVTEQHCSQFGINTSVALHT